MKLHYLSILLLLAGLFAVNTGFGQKTTKSPRVHVVNEEEEEKEERKTKKSKKDKEEDEEGRKSKPSRKGAVFPFVDNKVDAHYDLNLNIEDSAVILKYAALFARHKLPFTTETWEDIISQIVETTDEYLVQNVVFRVDDDALLISTGNDTYKALFLEKVLPVVSNLGRLNAFLYKIDKGRIPEE